MTQAILWLVAVVLSCVVGNWLLNLLHEGAENHRAYGNDLDAIKQFRAENVTIAKRRTGL